MGIKILSTEYHGEHKGNMYHPPTDYYEVKFSDGEVVIVACSNETYSCGLCYQEGETHEKYGEMAIEDVTRRLTV